MELKSQSETIIGEKNTFGQGIVGFLPGKFAGQVGEVSLARFEHRDRLKRFCNRHVGLMVGVAKSINDQHIKIFQQPHRGVGDFFHVRDVSQRAQFRMIKSKTMGPDIPVFNLDRSDAESVEIEGVGEFTGSRTNITRPVVLEGKGPGIHSFQAVEGFPGAVKRKRFGSLPAKGAEFVKSGDVVKVLVGVKHGIHPGDLFPQGLLAQVGSGIDEEITPWTGQKTR